MKSILRATTIAVLTAATSTASAGQMIYEGNESKKTIVEPCPPDSHWVIAMRGSFTGESDFERGDNAKGHSGFGQFEFGHRFDFPDLGWPNVECGRWYLRTGINYQRWEFDNSGGLPIPNHLQSISAKIALEYLVRGRTAVLLETEPGVYFQNDIDLDTFDAPTKVAAAIGVTESFYLVVGASYAGMRSYPLLPIVGFSWNVTDRLTINAVPPEPRIIYAASDKLRLWAGGELAGGAFRTDAREVERKPNLNDAVVTYSEYRAGAGFTYSCGGMEFELGAGYAFQRKFDFHRAEEGYETDEGAPYVKVELKASF